MFQIYKYNLHEMVYYHSPVLPINYFKIEIKINRTFLLLTLYQVKQTFVKLENILLKNNLTYTQLENNDCFVSFDVESHKDKAYIIKQHHTLQCSECIVECIFTNMSHYYTIRNSL